MNSREETSTTRSRWGIGTAIVLVLAGIAITVAVGVFRGAVPGEAIATPTASDVLVVDAEPIAPDGVFVHVSGAVTTPGLYVLNTEARVIDAIAAAGGFASEADRASVNLAREIADGEQLYVAIPGEMPAPGAASSAGGLINVNNAEASSLEELPGIGPALAQRIVDWRTQNGRFTSVDDLLAVTGIGDTILGGLRDLISVS